MEFTLSLTHRCNLECQYCYGGKKFNQDMTLSTAKKIVEFAIERLSPGNHFMLNFFGGEPLLCFDRMQEIVQYAHEKSDGSNKMPIFSVVTNGTLLNSNTLEFLKSNQFKLCISIDGTKEIHDRNRMFPDGSGSFDLVVRNLAKALQIMDSVQVNSVYGPDTIEALPSTVRFLIGVGAYAIHLNFNVRADWNHTHFQLIEKSFSNVADLYIESYEKGQEIALNLFDSKIIVLMKRGYDPGDMCTLGRMEWAFSPSGNIYPCERFIGEDRDPSHCLGNIHGKIEMDKLCKLQDGSRTPPPECTNCDVKKYCMNWCICTNYFLSGNSSKPSPVLCVIERALINQGKKIVSKLIDNDLFIDHFYSYLTKH